MSWTLSIRTLFGVKAIESDAGLVNYNCSNEGPSAASKQLKIIEHTHCDPFTLVWGTCLGFTWLLPLTFVEGQI